MKLNFGDLVGKAQLETKLTEQAKREQQIKTAMREMNGFISFPASNAGIHDYPKYLHRFGLPVLREAAYRISRQRLQTVNQSAATR